MGLDPVEFCLSEFVRECTASLSLRAEQKGLELHAQIAPDVPDFLVGEKARFMQEQKESIPHTRGDEPQ